MGLKALRRTMAALAMAFALIASISAFADASYAADATDVNYADEFLSDGEGNKPGWDNDVITQLDHNIAPGNLNDVAGTYVDAGWNFLFSIDKFLFGIAILFFVGRIVGRGIWEMAFSGAPGAEVPKMLRTQGQGNPALGRGKYPDGGRSSGGDEWLLDMCKDSLKGFLVGAGVVLILNVVAGLVLFGLGILPAPDFSFFHLQGAEDAAAQSTT